MEQLITFFMSEMCLTQDCQLGGIYHDWCNAWCPIKGWKMRRCDEFHGTIDGQLKSNSYFGFLLMFIRVGISLVAWSSCMKVESLICLGHDKVYICFLPCISETT